MYKIIISLVKKEPVGCRRFFGNAFIPFDPANRDAQEFALWLKEGNIPEPAEEGGTVTPEWIQETIAKLLPNE